MAHTLLEHVQNAAGVRGDPPVPDEFVIDALSKIQRGELTVETYPNGTPRLKEIYRAAAALQASASTMH